MNQHMHCFLTLSVSVSRSSRSNKRELACQGPDGGDPHAMPSLRSPKRDLSSPQKSAMRTKPWACVSAKLSFCDHAFAFQG